MRHCSITSPSGLPRVSITRVRVSRTFAPVPEPAVSARAFRRKRDLRRRTERHIYRSGGSISGVIAKNRRSGQQRWFRLPGPAEVFTLEQVQQQFDTNLFSIVRMNRAVLPHMRRQQSGLLVYISSVLGRLVFAFAGACNASKFALDGLAGKSPRFRLPPGSPEPGHHFGTEQMKGGSGPVGRH